MAKQRPSARAQLLTRRFGYEERDIFIYKSNCIAIGVGRILEKAVTPIESLKCLLVRFSGLMFVS